MLRAAGARLGPALGDGTADSAAAGGDDSPAGEAPSARRGVASPLPACSALRPGRGPPARRLQRERRLGGPRGGAATCGRPWDGPAGRRRTQRLPAAEVGTHKPLPTSHLLGESWAKPEAGAVVIFPGNTL